MQPLRLHRRQLSLWLGLSFCGFSQGIRSFGSDEIAISADEITDPDDATDIPKPSADGNPDDGIAEHWSAARNSAWRWYERENLIDGVWKTTGITRPIHRLTSEPFLDKEGYVEETEIPTAVMLPEDRKRLGFVFYDTFSWQDRTAAIKPLPLPILDPETMPIWFGDRSEKDAGRSSSERRGRHGRPPSKWLRSLTSDEIRTWLRRVEIQDAHVRGMTFWTHLTRDHSFDPKNLKGLTEPELAELHGAAHEGF